MPGMAPEKQAMIEQRAAKDVESRGRRDQEQGTKATQEMNECNAVVGHALATCVQVPLIMQGNLSMDAATPR